MDKITIKGAGFKLTKPRLAVLDLLAHDHLPKTARAIWQSLGSRFNLASVYRALHLLEKIGLIFQETTAKEKYYYLAKQPHHHIICRRCQKIECVPCHHDFSKVKNFTDVSHQLLLTGLCPKCNK
ncbi:MAG: transcriptional repressor [Patescibacteria group bacterium]